jgi:molybdopterin molybdotransferase
MKKSNLKLKNVDRSKFVEVVPLMAALGHVSACDVEWGNKLVLSKGSLINPRQIGHLAEIGIDEISVYRKPNISVVVLGKEPLSRRFSLISGKNFDSNAIMIQAALESMRIRPVFMRRLINDPKLLRRLIPFAINQSDITIVVLDQNEKSFDNIQPFIKKAEVVFLKEGRELDLAHFATNKMKKIVFFLPDQANLIFEQFYKFVEPVIRIYMGNLPSPEPA